MRLHIEITTQATHIPWENVLRPGRGVIYHLLTDAAPTMAARLHNHGWGPHRMTPIGHGAPVFPRATPQPGIYTTAGPGHLEIGSPLPGLIEILAKELSNRDNINWGGTTLHIQQITPLVPPGYTSGQAEFRTTTPVVLKSPPPATATTSTATRRPTDILPNEEGFTAALEHNVHRKAETLGIQSDIIQTRLTWTGAKRSFAVKNGHRTGAPITVQLHAPPALLRALWSWGLGQANSAGFGWITT